MSRPLSLAAPSAIPNQTPALAAVAVRGFLALRLCDKNKLTCLLPFAAFAPFVFFARISFPLADE